MRHLGLTGGIGSGKSTVAKMLLDGGAVLIDADAVSRATTAAGGAAIPQIAAQFGPEAITAEGAMDRDAMRLRVFADAAARQQLEAIIHPLVSLESARQTELARLAGCELLVFDIPLLVESKRWRYRLDKVLVIDCEIATQISRVIRRSGWTDEAVKKAIASQATRAQRLAAADLVIYNDGLTLDALAAQVRQIAQRVTL
jgi:dephospho-CoA kinase